MHRKDNELIRIRHKLLLINLVFRSLNRTIARCTRARYSRLEIKINHDLFCISLA